MQKYHFYQKLNGIACLLLLSSSILLQASDDEKAMEVGDLFFHTIGVPCFNFEYGEYCKDETSFLFCNGGYDLGDTVTLNYVLSDIWKQDTMRTSLP